MRFDLLKKRLEAIEAATFQEAIVLEDGSKWIPKVPLLDMFVDLLEFCTALQLGQTPEPLSQEVLTDVTMWAKRKPLPTEHGILFTSISSMSKEIVENEAIRVSP
ncbi:MAG: hypothetical protein WCP70_04275 [Methanothrix sp.]